MDYSTDFEVDSYYILARALPSEMETVQYDKITVGARTIMGWRLEGELLSHTFNVHLKPSSRPLPTSKNTASVSLARFKYRYAIRVRRRYSYRWYLSCWLVRDLWEALSLSPSPSITLVPDVPVFPYIPGCEPSQYGEEAVFHVCNMQRMDALSVHTDGSPSECSHRRNLSALSVQSQATSVSSVSGEQEIPAPSIPGIPIEMPSYPVIAFPPGIPGVPDSASVPLVPVSAVPAVPAVPAVSGMQGVSGLPAGVQGIPLLVPAQSFTGEGVPFVMGGTEEGSTYPPYAYYIPAYAPSDAESVYTPVDSSVLNHNMGVMYVNSLPFCTVPIETQDISEEKDV